MVDRVPGAALGAVALVLLGAVAAAADVTYEEPFEEETWHQGWVDWRALDEARTDIIAAYRSDGLGVRIPPGGRRGVGPHLILPDGLQDVYFRYHIRFDSWAASDSGKLPGPADIGATTARGCLPPTESDPGWSARVLFEPPGTAGAGPGEIRLGYYTYHVKQAGSCGDFMHWDEDGLLEQRRWYCIEGHVAMNSPGEADGLLEAWVDGERAFRHNSMVFRREGETAIQVRSFWLNVYFGGSRIVNATNLDLRLDELALGTDRVGCLTRFLDDDGNPHEADIDYLFNEGVVAGCGANSFCPERLLTRGEVMALLGRILDPAAATSDRFDDDDDHWAEDAINRLAPLGVVRGCGRRMVCPDRPVTRGELAAFLRRAFAVPASEVNRFGDDDRSVFASDNDAIAAAGITTGCGDGSGFCPADLVPRDQAATLVARGYRWAGYDT